MSRYTLDSFGRASGMFKLFAVATAVSAAAASQAVAQRYIGFGGQGATQTADYYIGVQSLGSPSITTVLGPATAQQAEQLTFFRDRLVPAIGIANSAKRADNLQLFQGGTVYTGIQALYPDTTQFWISTDQTNWQLLTHREGLVLNGITFIEWGTYSLALPLSSVPAIGGLGVGVLILAVCGAGVMVIARRRAGGVALVES